MKLYLFYTVCKCKIIQHASHHKHPWILNYQEDLDWWHTVLCRVLVWSVTFKAFEIKSIGTLRGGLKSKQGRMIIGRFIQCVKDQNLKKEGVNLS